MMVRNEWQRATAERLLSHDFLDDAGDAACIQDLLQPTQLRSLVA